MLSLLIISSLLSFSVLNVTARIPMGNLNSECDDGKTNLNVDWDGSPVNYTCNSPILRENHNKEPRLECDHIPDGYMPEHFCMKDEIHYDNPLPTHASHRPVWPAFGEYVFIPPQRWSHGVEHGAVVLLTHPCADPKAVNKLKKIVKNCIRKHIISVSNQIPVDTPFALVAWGCRLRMAHVDEDSVVKFIKTYALHGPEGHFSKDGHYTNGLIEHAAIPAGSAIDDTNLCPST